MRALLLVLLATRAWASPLAALTNPAACPVHGFSVLAGAIGEEAAESVTNGPTALAAMGGAIDSTLSLLGPIFLDHPETLGAGHVNVNLLGQTNTLAQQDGVPLDPAQTVVFTQPVVAARLTYAATIRQAAIGLAASYGVVERLDLSLLMPLVFTAVHIAATRQVTHVLSPAGEFVPLPHQEVLRTTAAASGFAQGDLTVRGKYHLLDGPVSLAAILAFQFPTGVPVLLTGTGHYWSHTSLALAYPRGRWELSAQLGFLTDLSRVNFSKVAYGVGVSAIVIPQRLGAIVEVTGQSQIATRLNPTNSAVVTLRSDRTLATQPALGLFVGRTDQVNLSAGLRMPLLAVGAFTLLCFVTAIVPLNQQGLRPNGAFVTVGLGGGL